MKKNLFLFCLTTALFFGYHNNVIAQDAATPNPDAMKNWQTYMMPGNVHKMIASWSGKWNGEVTMWMAPGAPPQTSKSEAVNKMAMGGRYQISNHTGNMMGMPFEGMSTLAYDNAKKAFISTWIDNMGTGIMTLEGTWDDATKTINFMGKTVDPSDGTGKEVAVRETFKVMDNDHQMMEMYTTAADGSEFKTMEIKFSRKK